MTHTNMGSQGMEKVAKTEWFLGCRLFNTISDMVKNIPSCGYILINRFSLPEDAHWTVYYRPLEIRIKELYMKYKNKSEAVKILKKHQKEIDMVKKNPKEHSSAFCIMQKL